MIKPHIIVDQVAIVVVMPFNTRAKETLKSKIPATQRQWNPAKKSWILTPSQENYNLAISILEENFEDFRLSPLIFNKTGNVQVSFDKSLDTTSYYTMLGITEKATQAEIKKGHRKIVLDLHPDRGGNAAHFRMVQKAYEILSNPTKRRRYDLSRSLIYRKSVPKPSSGPAYSRYPYSSKYQAGVQQTYKPRYSVGQAVKVPQATTGQFIHKIYFNSTSKLFSYIVGELVPRPNCAIIQERDLVLDNNLFGGPHLLGQNDPSVQYYSYVRGEVVKLRTIPTFRIAGGADFAIYQDYDAKAKRPLITSCTGGYTSTVPRDCLVPYILKVD